MAYSDYTTPLFGSIDFGQYYAPVYRGSYDFQYRNRPDVVDKRKDGVYKADIICQYTDHGYTGSQTIQINNIQEQGLIASQGATAILAIPASYGNHQQTTITGMFGMYKIMSGCVTNFHTNPSYRYVLISKSNSVTLQLDNMDGSSYVQQIGSSDRIRLGAPQVLGFLAPVTDRSPAFDFVTPGNHIRTINSSGSLVDMTNRCNQLNSNTEYGVKYYSISQEIGLIDETAITKMISLNTAWAARPDSVFTQIKYFMPSTVGRSLVINYNDLGTVIASGFPIFTVDSYEQMIRYFQGEDYVSDNDSNPPPDDWSTDWDIYVRGANKPNIYVTMKSDKVDEWLTSDENESGISKEDITVEWRNRVFSEYPLKTFALKDWQKTKYNNQLNTTYMELVQLSYPSADDAPGNDPVWIPDAPPLTLIDYYGQWEFRLQYNKFTSTWCYAKIGVIGSPSVPDFTKMSNEGGQTNYGFNDSSTVTIHYDEYPPGYDPYPTPGKPSTPGIIGGDTLPTTPTDSALGLGLLTTTYLLTPAQCDELGAFLWNFDLFEKIKALNTSPLDNIVSIKIVPYAVSGTPREIVIGNVSTSINADKIGALPLYHVGSLEYAGRYDNFLDRGGDTSAHLFLPYIGFVPIDPIWFTDKKLDVYYAFDAVTGTCRAILVVDRIAVANYTSVCGIDIPLSMGSRAQQESAYVGASLGIMLAAAGAPVAGLAAGAGAVASIVQGDNKNQRTGGVSPITAQYETRMCYIVIESVDANYARSMGHDKGFPCNATYTLSQLKGFTQVVDTVDLSSIANATDQEKEEIRRLLVEGVYL